MPYTDFTEFVDSGHAWLRGELPASLKRAPVYPLLIVGLGRLLPVEAPERAAAEWLNALLLPVNGLLVYLVGRRWFGAAARWAAVWFLLLPMGMFCTAHVIVEPLLTGLILLTVWASGRGGATPYLAAAAASMTRYDAAGLILGVGLADLLRHRPPGRTLLRTGLAVAPLAAWLVLTGLTWARGSQDHYLTQIAEQPAFQPGWSLSIIARTAFDPQLLQAPVWLPALEPIAYWGLFILPLIMAVVGAAGRLAARDGAAVTAVVALAGYILAHAVFPFRIDRFGYPMAPVLILAAGAGLQATAAWLQRRHLPALAGKALLLVLGAVLAGTLIGQTQAVAASAGAAGHLASLLVPLGLLGIAVIWAGSLAAPVRLPQVVLLLGAALLLTTQVRKAAALLGTGQEMKNQVEAARWIRDQTLPAARVLSSNPGLLRLYAGRDPPGRFLGFEDIQAQTWPDILAECRRHQIEYVIWHDALWEVHGGYYADRMGLARFDPLAHPETAPGVRVERRFAKYPNLVIVSVVPEDGPQ
jgi:hypothetical protein